MTADHDPTDPFVHDLASDWFDRVDRMTRERFRSGIEAHPAEADAIRRQYDALRRTGLLAAGPLDGPAPDSWDAVARDVVRDADGARRFDAIGPYQPLEEIGRGGQATVYLAEDLRLNRPVALKVMEGLGPLSETMMRRFRREAEVASRLDHPAICPVYDAGLHEGVPYIAMRFVPGRTLAACIESSRRTRTGRRGEGATNDLPGEPDPISLGSATRTEMLRILKAVEQVARALHAAHEAGVVHRDVKPGNIIVTPTGEPVLVDFGLAGDEDAGLMTLTATGELLGTAAYMSPEQLMARRLRLDRRTDVYSLGVTLFECLTLARPYRATTREAIYEAIQFKEPIDVRSLNPMLPNDLRAVIETALEKDRDRRYQTAEAFADDLRRVRESEPVSARRVSALGRVTRWARRRPALATLCGVLALGIPALAAAAGYVIAIRPAVVEARRLAAEAEVERLLARGFDEVDHGDPAEGLRTFTAARDLAPDAPAAIVGEAAARRRLGGGDGGEDVAEPPSSAFEWFVASRRAVGPDAVRDADRAVLHARHARAIYQLALARAAFLADDIDAARDATDALEALWGESRLGLLWAALCASRFDPPRAERLLRRLDEHGPEGRAAFARRVEARAAK